MGYQKGRNIDYIIYGRSLIEDGILDIHTHTHKKKCDVYLLGQDYLNFIVCSCFHEKEMKLVSHLQQWGEGVHEMSMLLNKFGKFY